MRYIAIDLETTGLDPVNNNIIEFGAVLDDLREQKPLEELPRFHAYICMDEYKGQPYALSMHPTIFRRIANREEGYNYLYPNTLGKAFLDFLVKNGYPLEKKHGKEIPRTTINVGGKNFGTFDLQFLNNQTNFSSSVKIRSRILDPGILCLEEKDEVIPGLLECLKRVGVEKEVSHTTIEDSLDVIQVIRAKIGHIFKHSEERLCM
jgi:hypothetical protein